MHSVKRSTRKKLRKRQSKARKNNNNSNRQRLPGCICEEPCRSTKHHRQPSSRGGTLTPQNTSRLPACTHSLWHSVVYNLEVHPIALLISRYGLLGGAMVVVAPRNWNGACVPMKDAFVLGMLPHGDSVIHVTDSTILAWDKLFGQIRSTRKVLRIVNNFYLDYRYKLVLVI